jgi:hypothetical protein
MLKLTLQKSLQRIPNAFIGVGPGGKVIQELKKLLEHNCYQ